VNRVEQKIKFIEDYKVAIPVKHISDLYVKEGDEVKKGDILFTDEFSEVAYAHNIPFELEIDTEESADVMCRVDGEFITAGEKIAEKLSKGGLSTSKVMAQADGILNLSKIKYGIAEILSEKKKREYAAPFNCTIARIDTQDAIILQARAMEIVALASSDVVEESPLPDMKYHLPKQLAQFTMIKEGDSVTTLQDINEAVSGKVIYTGRHLQRDIAGKLLSAGAIWLITNSASYDDLEDVNGKVSVIQGFGNMECEKTLHEILIKMKGEHIVLDDLQKRLIFIGDFSKIPQKTLNNIEDTEKSDKDIINYVGVIKPGVRVISYDLTTFGKMGTVVEIEGGGEYCLVRYDDSDKSSVTPTSTLRILR